MKRSTFRSAWAKSKLAGTLSAFAGAPAVPSASRPPSATPASLPFKWSIMNDEGVVPAQILRTRRLAHAAALVVGKDHRDIEAADAAPISNGQCPARARRQGFSAERVAVEGTHAGLRIGDRKSTRLNSSH